MGTYPGPKVHRHSRRKLGKGQTPPTVTTTVVATTATPVVTLTYSSPVAASGAPALTVTGLTIVSWLQTSPTVITVTLSGTTTSATYAVQSQDPNVRPLNGGQLAGTSGTF